MAGYDSYTKFYTRFDNNWTATNPPVDLATGKVITVNGNTTVTSTSIGANFGYSCLFGSSNITLATSTDFEFGSGDFTVDFWTQLAANPTSGHSKTFYAYGVHITGGTFFDMQISSNGTITMTCYNGSSYVYQLQSVATLTLSQWNHIAGVRYGNNLILFLNGTSVATGTYAGSYFPTTQTPVFGFGASLDVAFSGEMDEIRISQGIARWTSNFTPNTAEYQPTAYYPFPPFDPGY